MDGDGSVLACFRFLSTNKVVIFQVDIFLFQFQQLRGTQASVDIEQDQLRVRRVISLERFDFIVGESFVHSLLFAGRNPDNQLGIIFFYIFLA